MGGKVITVIPLHLHPESLGHWALALVPINGVGCHTWLLSQHIAHHPVNLHLLCCTVAKLFIIIVIVHIVPNSDELLLLNRDIKR